jgi:peptidoglycan hydrolase-like protein with peptidoglycan-binding domain
MKARRSSPRAKRSTRAHSPFFSKESAEGGAEPFFPKKAESVSSASVSGGEPLSVKTRNELEPKFGQDLRMVRIHTDAQAAEASKSLHAEAFTFGQHIYFNRGKYNPGSPEGKKLLAHEVTHTLQQGSARPVGGGVSNFTGSPQVSKQGLLTQAQEFAAISFNNSRYDESSRRIIQDVVGVVRDAAIGSVTVEAIAAFQSANGLAADGKVGQDTLDRMILNRVGATRPEHAIHLVIDFFNITTSDTLSISFAPSLNIFSLANTSFETGGLRVIGLGPLAFLSAGIMRAVINQQLAIPRPATPPLTPQPTHLTSAQETAAIQFNRGRYQDRRAIMALQGVVGAATDGILGRDTAERIADFQSTNGLAVDGKAGEQTLRAMVAQLNAANQQNAAIRLIIDFFNLSESNSLLDIRFDATLTNANAATSGVIPGPSMIRIGPSAFAQGFEGLVHTIAHELEHVRQRRVGILNQDVREFLGEAVEILSVGMPEENVAGFFDDAGRALFHWNRIPVADQRLQWSRFVEVRNKVRQRFNAATAAEQALHAATMAGYNAVVRP